MFQNDQCQNFIMNTWRYFIQPFNFVVKQNGSRKVKKLIQNQIFSFILCQGLLFPTFILFFPPLFSDWLQVASRWSAYQVWKWKRQSPLPPISWETHVTSTSKSESKITVSCYRDELMEGGQHHEVPGEKPTALSYRNWRIREVWGMRQEKAGWVAGSYRAAANHSTIHEIVSPVPLSISHCHYQFPSVLGILGAVWAALIRDTLDSGIRPKGEVKLQSEQVRPSWTTPHIVPRLPTARNDSRQESEDSCLEKLHGPKKWPH